MYPLADIKELVRFAKAGDREAFAELVAAYQNKVYSLGYHLTGNQADAQDLVQEVFLRAFLSLKGFRQEADFGTWLHRITVNQWINSRRRQKNHSTVSLDTPIPTDEGDLFREVAATGPDPLETVTEHELQEMVHRALKELSPDFRTVLVLREIEGYNYEEIARMVGCSLGTVKSRLNRARQALRQKVALRAAEGGFGPSEVKSSSGQAD